VRRLLGTASGAAVLVRPLTPAEAAPRAPARLVDAIAGSTFVLGSAALNAPGQPLRIRPGDTVVWTNLDPISHDVAFDLLPFNAYLKNPGDSAELTFDQPGHFEFHCNQHPELPGMHGLVFVTNDAP
jgi:plastocyanin